jgi:hypothetical protein
MVGWRREGEGERSGFVILAVRFGSVFPTLLNFSLVDRLGCGIICAQEKKGAGVQREEIHREEIHREEIHWEEIHWVDSDRTRLMPVV